MDMPTDQIAPSWVWVMLMGMGAAILALSYVAKFLFGKLMEQQAKQEAMTATVTTAILNNTVAVESLERHLQGAKKE